jgi:hypothetical protein
MLVVLVATGGPAAAQESVTIQVPSFVSFQVTDVSVATPGAPSPSTLSFSNAFLGPGRVLRVSVQADAASFTPPNGLGIPVTKVSWSSLGAAGGTAWDGSLSSSSYIVVFQSDPVTTQGHVGLAWSLAPPGNGIRAGQHGLTVRWKVEALTP